MYIWGPCHFGSSSISRRLEYFLGQVKSIKRIGRELDTLVGSWVEEHAMRKAKSEQIDKPDFIDVMLSIIEDVDMFFHLNTPLILIFYVPFIVHHLEFCLKIFCHYLYSFIINHNIY